MSIQSTFQQRTDEGVILESFRGWGDLEEGGRWRSVNHNIWGRGGLRFFFFFSRVVGCVCADA